MDTSYSWLKDFDYSVRLILSSESLSGLIIIIIIIIILILILIIGLRQPVVLLKVDCQQPDGTIGEKLIELVWAFLLIYIITNHNHYRIKLNWANY